MLSSSKYIISSTGTVGIHSIRTRFKNMNFYRGITQLAMNNAGISLEPQTFLGPSCLALSGEGREGDGWWSIRLTIVPSCSGSLMPIDCDIRGVGAWLIVPTVSRETEYFASSVSHSVLLNTVTRLSWPIGMWALSDPRRRDPAPGSVLHVHERKPSGNYVAVSRTRERPPHADIDD